MAHLLEIHLFRQEERNSACHKEMVAVKEFVGSVVAHNGQKPARLLQPTKEYFC
ncbi:MAG TPA: hypothetical protein VJ809_02795 [Pirellulales bacterium]|nr:hypothetical protein [Pirellulales bacterium]